MGLRHRSHRGRGEKTTIKLVYKLKGGQVPQFVAWENIWLNLFIWMNSFWVEIIFLSPDLFITSFFVITRSFYIYQLLFLLLPGLSIYSIKIGLVQPLLLSPSTNQGQHSTYSRISNY